MVDLVVTQGPRSRIRIVHVKDTTVDTHLALVAQASEPVQVAAGQELMDKIKIIPSMVQTVDLVG
jgi:hypothetical protein